MGALVMAHSDDQGLVLPPKLAPHQVVIVPIFKTGQLEQISEKVLPLKKELESKGVRVKFDDRDTERPGWKFAEYELLGVPVRLGLGMRDLENGTVELARRDTMTKTVVPLEGLADRIVALLDEIQESIYQKALQFRNDNITRVDSYEDFKQVLDTKAGFVSAHWDGTTETEERIKEETKATIRCIPMNNPQEEGRCILTGQPSQQRVLFARAY